MLRAGRLALLLAVTGLLAATSLTALAQKPIVWRFDNLTQIGGNKATVVGSPKIIDTDLGKAVHFEGNNSTGDALFFDTAVLTGAGPYTWEVIFRPATGGRPEQRFFHLQEEGSQSRRLFETRLVDGKWCLDSFGATYAAGQPPRTATLLKCDAEHLFPLDQWHVASAVYDGKTLRNYVDGILQNELAVKLDPLGKGGTSVGTRYNKRDFFTGDIYSARFLSNAVPVSALWKVPAKKHLPK